MAKAAAAVKEKEEAGKKMPSALSAVLAQIQKEFGDGAIMRLGHEESKANIPVISTGALTLDMALRVVRAALGRELLAVLPAAAPVKPMEAAG